jgi:methyltransferase family protein
MTQELNEYCEHFGRRFGVSPDIHPNDLIFRFLETHPSFDSLEGSVQYYFEDGARSASKLADLLYKNLGFDPATSVRLLEFAAGYGCVTRHLANALPGAQVVSSDIHPQANRFLTEKIGVKSLQSVRVPEAFAPRERFDVVFALSFFSHMPRLTWGRWIKSLFGTVERGGYFIFTTHGIKSAPHFGNPDVPDDGFWFAARSEQEDLDVADYGMTLTTREFVIRELFTMIRAPQAAFREACWWDHQDLYIVKKPALHPLVGSLPSAHSRLVAEPS